MSEQAKRRAKKLGLFDMMMIISCSMLDTDLISSNTSAGMPIVGWWIVIGVLYLLPFCFLTTELTLAFPKKGGIYYWIEASLGSKWATRASFIYWANGVFMLPASFLMVSDIVCTMFFPQVGYWGRTLMAIAVLWLSTFVACLPMGQSKYVFDLTGALNIFMYLFVFAAGLWYISTGHAPANELSLGNMLPRMNEAVVFVPVALFCASGVEVCSMSIEDSENPHRDLKKALLIFSAAFIVINCLASIGILLISPLDDMSIMSGIADIFIVAWQNRPLYIFTCFAVILGIFSQCSSWTIAGGRSLAESAKEGVFPKIFAGETKAGLPINAIVLDSALGTVMLIAYALVADTAAALFFALMSCVVVAATLPYVLVMISYQKLRRGALKSYTGYKAPGGVVLSWVLQITQILVTMLLIWIPGVGFTETAGITVIGSLAVVIFGEFVIMMKERENRKNSKHS